MEDTPPRTPGQQLALQGVLDHVESWEELVAKLMPAAHRMTGGCPPFGWGGWLCDVLWALGLDWDGLS